MIDRRKFKDMGIDDPPNGMVRVVVTSGTTGRTSFAFVPDRLFHPGNKGMLTDFLETLVTDSQHEPDYTWQA